MSEENTEQDEVETETEAVEEVKTNEPSGGLVVQKDTRPKKKQRKGLSVMDKVRRDSAKFRRAMKNRNRHRHADPFPNHKYVVYKEQVKKLREDASEDEKEANKEMAFTKALVLEKGYANLPTQRGIQIGTKRGNGKTFIGTKGRIRTRRNMKASQKGKPGVRHA